MKQKKQLQARRKQEQKSSPGFGWVKPLLAASIVAASAVGLTLMLDWLQDPRQWPVEQVHIEGQFRHLPPGLLQAEVEPLASAGFFVVNVSDIQQHLQQLAWVDQVSVRRVWPDRLELQVHEQQPIARWGEGSYMNVRAEVFTPDMVIELPELPWLIGPQGHQQQVLGMHKAMRALVRPLQLDVVRLQLDARRTWRIELSNSLTLEVGRIQPMERLARFVRVYPAILAAGNGRLISVDLRYSHGFAVHWDNAGKATRGAG